MRSLQAIVEHFAKGMSVADARRPREKNYHPVIGSHAEPQTIALAVKEWIGEQDCEPNWATCVVGGE